MNKEKVLRYFTLILLIVVFVSVISDSESGSNNILTTIALPAFGISWVLLQIEKRKKKK